MLQEECWEGCRIFCEAIPMGRDYTLTVWGGEQPHIGSVVMAAARPSLTGTGISTTSSVLNAMGHKDETVARLFAETVAAKMQCIAVCACGIHVEHISEWQLDRIHIACQQLLRKIVTQLEACNTER